MKIVIISILALGSLAFGVYQALRLFLEIIDEIDRDTSDPWK